MNIAQVKDEESDEIIPLMKILTMIYIPQTIYQIECIAVVVQNERGLLQTYLYPESFLPTV